MDFYTNVSILGNNVCVRGVVNDKRKNEKIPDFSPRVWIPENTGSSSEWHTLTGTPVKEFQIGTIKETRNFIQENRDVDNFAVYGDISPEYQYITQRYTEEIHADLSKIVIAYLDIETARNATGEFSSPDKADGEVISIALKLSNIEKTFMFGMKDYDSTDKTNICYVKCEDEEHMLARFMEVWTANYPDIVTGWYLKYFDLPYLINRLTLLWDESYARKISPWKAVRLREDRDKNGRQQNYFDIIGISTLDYQDLYKKFSNKVRESYSLDYISYEELGERKVDYSEYGTLHELYEKNFQLFIDYNKQDIDLIMKLENKMKLLELAIMMAHRSRVNFEDVFSQIRMWDAIVYNYLLKKKIVIPPKKKNPKITIPGAFVKDPVPGLYDWVVSFDLTSLYPMLIQQYNISPETLIKAHLNVNLDELIDKSYEIPEKVYSSNLSLAANGHMFKRTKLGVFPELMAWMFEERKNYKKKKLQFEQQLESSRSKMSSEGIRKCNNDISKYEILQWSTKIQLNSAYGALANEYYRYYDPRLASAITLSGQLSIRWIERKLNEYLNRTFKTKNKDYIIAVDTDSVYINFQDIVERISKNKTKTEIIDTVDRICKEKITPFIDASYQELAEYMNAMSNKMFMKREVIADRGIWTAKKKYILYVYDSEGTRYEQPKLKMMGIEAIKSSTPGICRDKLKEAIKIIMTKSNEDLIEFIEIFRKEFHQLQPESIAFPRSVKGLDTYSHASFIYDKGTPIHVRGSLLYNYYLHKKELNKTYLKINNGDKIKFIYLKEPNPIRENVIAFPTSLPKEFGLHDFVNYNLQFEKTFIDPLKIILNEISWTDKTVNTLDI